MGGLRSYWRWLGRRLRLSQPGRVFFTTAVLVGVAAIVLARAHGAREGGAPLVVLALVLAGVVALDAAGQGVIAVVRRFTSLRRVRPFRGRAPLPRRASSPSGTRRRARRRPRSPAAHGRERR